MGLTKSEFRIQKVELIRVIFLHGTPQICGLNAQQLN
jgi:hypothetical protein